MKEKEFINWTKYRKIGKLKYTLLWGVYYIILLNVASSVGDFITRHFTFDIKNIIIRIIFSGLFGIFMSRFVWKNSEAKYIDYLNKL